MWLNIVLIAFGFILLIQSADWLVEHSASLAKKIGVSPLIIGLTLVAFGTSAPELVVNIISSLKGSSELIFGNIIGSNIANICLIVGLSALIMPLGIKSQTIFKEMPLMLLGGAALAILSLDTILNQADSKIIHFGDGLILLLLFFVFLYYTINSALSNRDKAESEFKKDIKKNKTGLSLSLIGVSLFGLFLGGRLVVDNAVDLAVILGISQKLIGLTIVAIGTSLPELITSIMAALKKEADIAIGNIVGSNIFNTTFIIGVSALIRPIELPAVIAFDLSVMTISFLLLFLFSLTKRKIEKWEGFVLLVIYLAYILLLIFRG